MQPDCVTSEVQDLLPDYLADARECLERVSSVLLALDSQEMDADLLGELFRQMHVIKGGAGLMGFACVGGVAHAAEDLLGAAKRGELSLGPAVAAVLLEGHDVLRALLDELEAAGCTATSADVVIERLKGVRTGGGGLPDEKKGPGTEVAAVTPPAPVSDSDEQAEVLHEFFLESGELVEELDQDLVALEEDSGNKELLNKIFRAAHTLKGSSSFLGFQNIGGVTHHVEDIFNKLRKDEMKLTPELMDVILEAVDRVKRMLGAAQEGEEGPPTADLVAALSEAVRGGGPRKLGEILVQDEGVAADVVQRALDARSSDKPLGQTLVEEGGVPRESVERSLAKQARQNVVGAQGEQTVRVDVERLDALLNLVGELVLGKNRLMRLRTELDERWEGDPVLDELGAAAAQIDLVASDLQTAVMKTRLVAIDKVFRKFPRMVRDLSRSLGKEIRLEIQGEGTELDKSVVEIIGDPLVHLIRNSADHGVESPEIRVRAGKPREGKIRLSACHDGNHIVVAVEDDGKGMDPEVLKRKALEKGLITAQEAAAMSVKDAFALIFAPGFSTATQVTSVSGRGVGMDVVKTNIQQVSGVVDIDSTFGRGTRVEVRIPLTLAIIQALLVRCGREVYAVPLVSVVETVRVEPGDLKTVDQHPVLRLRDRVMPLLFLQELFRVPLAEVREGERRYVVVLGVGERRVGLVVDRLVGEEEVVIKNLGTYLSDVPGIAGATIRGDGRVTLIVDVSQLLHLATRPGAVRRVRPAA